MGHEQALFEAACKAASILAVQMRLPQLHSQSSIKLMMGLRGWAVMMGLRGATGGPEDVAPTAPRAGLNSKVAVAIGLFSGYSLMSIGQTFLGWRRVLCRSH